MEQNYAEVPSEDVRTLQNVHSETESRTLEVDTGKFKITVTSVGTLDLKGFIEMAMSLPSFYKS